MWVLFHVGPPHSIFSIHTTLDQSIITWCLIFQFIFQHHTNVPTQCYSHRIYVWVCGCMRLFFLWFHASITLFISFLTSISLTKDGAGRWLLRHRDSVRLWVFWCRRVELQLQLFWCLDDVALCCSEHDMSAGAQVSHRNKNIDPHGLVIIKVVLLPSFWLDWFGMFINDIELTWHFLNDISFNTSFPCHFNFNFYITTIKNLNNKLLLKLKKNWRKKN